MKIAVIVPFYNESKNLPFFINEWQLFLKKKSLQDNFFFFFIDDGSIDDSSRKIKKNIKSLKFKIIKKKNSGHGHTCRFGYRYIINKYKKFDYLMQIDSDNQCDPRYAFSFCNLMKKENCKFIFGYRKTRADGFIRYIVSRIMSWVFFVKKFTYIKDLNTPYRLMKAKELRLILNIIDKKDKYKKIELFNSVLSYVIIQKYPINWIDINFRNRYSGNSKYNFLRMLLMFMNFIIKI